MDYTAETWVDETGVGDGTEVTADRMNNIEAGIVEAVNAKFQNGTEAARLGVDVAEYKWRLWNESDTGRIYLSDGSGWFPFGPIITDYSYLLLSENSDAADWQADLDIQVTAEKDQPGGYAGLDGSGLIATSQIPAVALTTVQVAASQAAMLALTTQAGDVVIRTDQHKTYMHNGGTAGTMADFTVLDTPLDAVTSVNGQAGTVVLNYADVGAQVAHSNLTALAGLSLIADRLVYANGTGTLALATLTPHARNLLAQGTNAAHLTELGFSTFFQTLLGSPNAGGVLTLLGAPGLSINNIFTNKQTIKRAIGNNYLEFQDASGTAYFSLGAFGASTAANQLTFDHAGTSGIRINTNGWVEIDADGGFRVITDMPVPGVAMVTGEDYLVGKDALQISRGGLRGLVLGGVVADGIELWGNYIKLNAAQVDVSGTKLTHDGTDVVCVIRHGATAGTTRPSGPEVVIWIGTVAPTNMTGDDIWLDSGAELAYDSVVPVVTSLPAGPTDGQEVDFVADATNFVIWRFRFRAATGKWHFVGGPALSTETTATYGPQASGTFTNITGSSLIAPLAGEYDVEFSNRMYNTATTSPAQTSTRLGNGAAQYGTMILDMYEASTQAEQKTMSAKTKCSLGAGSLLALQLSHSSGGAGGSYCYNRAIFMTPIWVTG